MSHPAKETISESGNNEDTGAIISNQGHSIIVFPCKRRCVCTKGAGNVKKIWKFPFAEPHETESRSEERELVL